MKKKTNRKITIGIILSIFIYMSYIGNNMTFFYSYYDDYDVANLYAVLYATINYFVNFITISLIPFIIKKYKFDFFRKNVNKIYVFNGVFWFFGSIPLFSILYASSTGLGLLGALIFSIISYCFISDRKLIEVKEENEKEKMDKADKNNLVKDNEKKEEKIIISNEIKDFTQTEQDKQYCLKCGKEVEIYWNFCNYCGNKIINEEKTMENPPKEDIENKLEDNKKRPEEKDVLKLLDYKKLLDNGAITQEEYNKKKKEILGD